MLYFEDDSSIAIGFWKSIIFFNQLLLCYRKLQVAATKWQSLHEAGPTLSQHGQKLQILGVQLAQLVVIIVVLHRHFSTQEIL